MESAVAKFGSALPMLDSGPAMSNNASKNVATTRAQRLIRRTDQALKRNAKRRLSVSQCIKSETAKRQAVPRDGAVLRNVSDLTLFHIYPESLL